MSGKADWTSNVTSDIPVAGAGSATRARSEAASSTFSSTMADQAMARKEIQSLYQHWKAPTMIDEDIVAYHDAGWLSGALICTPTTLDFPTID
jgi:hypothetical protein